MDKHPLQDLLEHADYTCRSYSGRAMYGKTCLAVEIDGTMGMLISCVIQAVGDGVVPNYAEAAEAFMKMKTDSMGLGTIAYFPGIGYVGDEEDDDG